MEDRKFGPANNRQHSVLGKIDTQAEIEELKRMTQAPLPDKPEKGSAEGTDTKQ